VAPRRARSRTASRHVDTDRSPAWSHMERCQ
jgi:hypothetical protein